jgi:hypothetical protein
MGCSACLRIWSRKEVNKMADRNGSESSLSAQCLATAEAISEVRRRLYQLVQNGSWPAGSFASLSRVLVEGDIVARALTRIGTDNYAEALNDD